MKPTHYQILVLLELINNRQQSSLLSLDTLCKNSDSLILLLKFSFHELKLRDDGVGVNLLHSIVLTWLYDEAVGRERFKQPIQQQRGRLNELLGSIQAANPSRLAACAHSHQDHHSFLCDVCRFHWNRSAHAHPFQSSSLGKVTLW